MLRGQDTAQAQFLCPPPCQTCLPPERQGVTPQASADPLRPGLASPGVWINVFSYKIGRMGRDDSNQTFLWRQTKNRVEMRENAYRGVEATEELHEFGYRFGERMNDISRNVDMDSVEARSFKHAFEELQDEFEAFMSLVPLSGPAELVELTKQAGDLMQKLDALPGLKKRRPPPTAPPPDASVGQTTEQPAP